MAARLDRDDRLRVYKAGGFTGGGLMDEPVDITIENIPAVDFERAKLIIKLLTAKADELTNGEKFYRSRTLGWVGDFGYFVEAGNNDVSAQDLTIVFMGSFKQNPMIVRELQDLLKNQQHQKI